MSVAQAIVRAQFGFNQAMNERLWTMIMEHLSDEQFAHTDGYSRGSIRNQLVHMANAQHDWFRGVLNVPDLTELNAEDYPTRESARLVCQRSDQMCVDTLLKLTDADLERIPEIWSQPVWVALLQMAHHSTDHRAQILRALHDLGLPTFEQNFTLWMENSTPLTVQEAIGHISSKRAEWNALLEKVPADQIDQPMMDSWTVRDSITVMTWKEQRTIEMLRNRFAVDVMFSTLPQVEQTDLLQANRALPLATLIEQHQATNRDLLNTLQTLTDADLNIIGERVGLPPDEPYWKAIAIATWWNYPAFIASLRQLLKA